MFLYSMNCVNFQLLHQLYTWTLGQSTRLNRVRLSNTVTSATGWRGIRARPEANVHALVTCGRARRPGTPGSP